MEKNELEYAINVIEKIVNGNDELDLSTEAIAQICCGLRTQVNNPQVTLKQIRDLGTIKVPTAPSALMSAILDIMQHPTYGYRFPNKPVFQHPLTTVNATNAVKGWEVDCSFTPTSVKWVCTSVEISAVGLLIAFYITNNISEETVTELEVITGINRIRMMELAQIAMCSIEEYNHKEGLVK